MKNIHPKYYNNTKVKCACGNEFTIGSTKELIETEICANCHPFYTGQERGAVRGGRVERFQSRISQKKTYTKKTQKRARKAQAKEKK